MFLFVNVHCFIEDNELNIILKFISFIHLYWNSVIQVILANDRSEGCVRDPKEDEKMKRLFIMVPSGYTEKEVENDFKVSSTT